MQSLLRLALACAGAALPLACTAILGDDFEIVPSGSGAGANGSGGGGTGASSGGAGPGGNAGAAPAPYYNCDWDLPEHRLVTSHELNPLWFFDSLFAARRGPDSVRAVAMKPTGLEDFLDIWTLDSSANIGFSAWPALEVHAVERVSTSEIGILYTKGSPNGPELHILVVDDGDPDGLAGLDVALATPSTLPEHDPMNFQLNAQMAPVPQGGLDDWELDFIVGYQNTTGTYALYYARYDGLNVSPFVRLNVSALDDNDVEPRGMVHYDGLSYAYFGDTGASLGSSVWVVDPTITGFVMPLQLAALEQFIDIEGFSDYANVAMFTSSPSIRFLTGAVGGAELAAFGPDDLLVAAEFTAQLDLPVFEADARWNDDILTMIGPDADRSLDMAYYFLDNEGRERALGPLDFTLILPAEESRRSIGWLASALRGDPLDETGGTLHVVWTEGHERNTQQFDVLYYDRLRCTPE